MLKIAVYSTTNQGKQLKDAFFRTFAKNLDCVVDQVYRCRCQIANLRYSGTSCKKNLKNCNVTSRAPLLVICFSLRKRIIRMGKYTVNDIERNCFRKYDRFFKENINFIERIDFKEITKRNSAGIFAVSMFAAPAPAMISSRPKPLVTVQETAARTGA